MVEGEQLDAGMYYDDRLGLSAADSTVVVAYKIRTLSRILESGLGIVLAYTAGISYQKRTRDDVGQ